MFNNFYVNLRKNEGFLTSIPCIPIPEYGQLKRTLSNVGLARSVKMKINDSHCKLTLPSKPLIGTSRPGFARSMVSANQY